MTRDWLVCCGNGESLLRMGLKEDGVLLASLRPREDGLICVEGGML